MTLCMFIPFKSTNPVEAQHDVLEVYKDLIESKGRENNRRQAQLIVQTNLCFGSTVGIYQQVEGRIGVPRIRQNRSVHPIEHTRCATNRESYCWLSQSLVSYKLIPKSLKPPASVLDKI